MLIKTFLMIIAVAAVLYILYINGLITVGNKKAVIFLGNYSLSRKCFSASFKACTGNIKRVLILKESREYTFDFSCKIENGEIKAVLKDSDKNDIFVLTPLDMERTVYLERGRYYLDIECYKAYGNYNFKWK